MTWTTAKNNRRCELIDKEVNGGGLSLAESRELTMLQDKMLAHRRRVAPLPIAEARAALASMQESR